MEEGSKVGEVKVSADGGGGVELGYAIEIRIARGWVREVSTITWYNISPIQILKNDLISNY